MKPTLMIQDLPMDKALDRKAMAAVCGGQGMYSAPATPLTSSAPAMPATTSIANTSSTTSVFDPGWGRGFDTHIPAFDSWDPRLLNVPVVTQTNAAVVLQSIE